MMDLFRHLRIHTQTRKGKPMYTFGKTSMSKLKGVHQDLVSIMVEAISTSKVDFGISEGLRTKDRQKELVREGKSQTMNSSHLTGHAGDIFIYKDKISSLDNSFSIRRARSISLNFLVNSCFLSKKKFLATCMVMVLPPPTTLPSLII